MPETRRLLVIDDEENMRHMLQSVLGRLGYAVRTAANGVEGLATLAAEPFDTVLCDLRMPEMDGMEFYRRAVASRAHLAEHFLFTTGDTYDVEVKAFLEDNRVDYIRKPFRIKELLGKVSQRLSQIGEEA